jgi:hypothetical protein
MLAVNNNIARGQHNTLDFEKWLSVSKLLKLQPHFPMLLLLLRRH